MKIKVHIIFEHSYDYRPYGSASLRLLRPFTHPTLRDRLDVTTGTSYLGQPVDILIMDRMWCKHVSVPQVENLVARVRQGNAKLVYALDDNFFEIPAEHSIQFRAEEIQVVDYLLHTADCVLVTTQRLKQRFGDHNDCILVLPHALDEGLLVPRLPATPDLATGKKPITIGYMGSYSHDEDLLMVLPALHQICTNHPRDIELQIVGGIGKDSTKQSLAGLPVRHLVYEPGEEEYPLFMLWFTGNVNWDIAIAPLRDVPFNTYKSDVKLLDYCAIGTAGVFSQVPAYQDSIQHMQTGWLVENNTDAWVEAMDILIKDDDLRIRIARNAYAYLYSQRTLQKCAHRWLDALHFILES